MAWRKGEALEDMLNEAQCGCSDMASSEAEADYIYEGVCKVLKAEIKKRDETKGELQ